MTIRSDDFQFLIFLLKQHSGLVIGEEKAGLMETRLVALARKYGLNGVEDICQRLRGQGDPMLKEDVVEAMTTNVSYFFRDGKPFEQFRQFVLPELLKQHVAKKKLRIWSAAAASGKEAYSLAIMLHQAAAELADWQIEIIGTDISRTMIERAQQGIYTQFEVQRGLPIRTLLAYFTQQGDKWQINENIRAMVQFQTLNLLDDFSALGHFDVILCRNVLLYFDQTTKTRVLHGLARQLAPPGFLYLGDTETMLGLSTRFKPVPAQRGIYMLASEEPASMFKTV